MSINYIISTEKSKHKEMEDILFLFCNFVTEKEKCSGKILIKDIFILKVKCYRKL